MYDQPATAGHQVSKRTGAILWAVLLTAAVATSRQPAAAPSAESLQIYFVDVEGGQATLIVSPARQSLLVDTGFAGFDGRDAGRILAAARDAGVTSIDVLLTTHFHFDHDGGVVDLARQIPIRTYVDHGDLGRTAAEMAGPNWPGTLALYNAYTAVRATGRHLEPTPGDRLPLDGLDVTMVSSAGKTITHAMAGAGGVTEGCEATAPPPEDAFENPRSSGFVLQFGAFRFLDPGDLTGPPLHVLVCPRSLIGAVDLYLVPHHGGADASYPATFAAFAPRVAIVNNGAVKGGVPAAFVVSRRAPDLERAWQLHQSTTAGAVNLAPSQIANLDESTAHWIKVIATADGAFSVTNGRTGATRSFEARSAKR